MATQSRYTLAADGERLRRIEISLRHYPDVSPDENREILQFLKSAPVLDAGLLTGNEEIRPQLQRFRHDHRRELGMGAKDYLVAAVILLVVIALGFLLWDAGS